MLIRDVLIAGLSAAGEAEGLVLPAEIGLEQPTNREHGDWSSNLAMASAKAAGRNPRELATALVERLRSVDIAHVDRVEIAGPGFINFHLSQSWLHDVLVDVAEMGVEMFGRNNIGDGRRVNVEFVSANPTGPLHAGHARGAVFGDTLARLLEWCGYEVTRETYINDRGVQMQNYARSLAARAAGQNPPDDGYLGQYIIDWAADMPADADPLNWGYDRALADQRQVLAMLDIEFDVWFSESSLVESGAIASTLAELDARGATYETEGAIWLRTTDFGDDKDRVLVKSDGDYTYLTPDVAYHADKFSRADELVDVWGADHHGYVSRMKAAMQFLGHESDELDVRITQLVKLMRGGEEVKLSKRSGELVELREVIDEVGPDATRFTYLVQSIDSQLTFDMKLAASRAMDNPVFYTQYAHARIASIERKASEVGIARAPLSDVDLSLLVHDRELEILRALFTGEELIALAGRERAPHRLVGWVRELAAAFHGFYHDCYVMGDGVSAELTQARLWLVEATRVGLVTGLGLLGVSAPDEMWSDEEVEEAEVDAEAVLGSS